MGHEKDTKVNDKLLPADIEDILEKYGHLLKSYLNLPGKDSVFANKKRTNKRLEVLFPLKEHPIHGITGLHAVEVYGEPRFVRLYHYHWKIILPKMGVKFSHISGWGNDHMRQNGPQRSIGLIPNHTIITMIHPIEEKEDITLMFARLIKHLNLLQDTSKLVKNIKHRHLFACRKRCLFIIVLYYSSLA